MTSDPSWPRASAWLRGEHLRITVRSLTVVGAPMRLGSISGGRFDLAPDSIRRALDRFSVHDSETGHDLREVAAHDAGNVDVADMRPGDALELLSPAVADTLGGHDAALVLGGDNSITRPGVHGMLTPLARVGLLTLDAHHDLRDTSEGLNNGNPIRALLDDGLLGSHVVQVGIQPFANSPAYAAVARDAGITVVPPSEVRKRGIETVVLEALDALAATADAIYVDLDVDVLDRAFAPACPGSRPGGLAPWEIQTAARLAGEHPKVRAMDIVEIDPERDVADITVMAAASCVLSFASGLAARPR